MTRLLPIWPGPRMPLNTRDGVALAPIEPGRAHVVRAVADRAAVEVVALDRALEALALRAPGDLDRLALLERVDRHLRRRSSSSPRASPRNSARWRSAGAPAFFRWPSSRLGERASRRLAEGELDGVVAVALGSRGRRSRSRGRPRSRSRARRSPSSVKSCVMPIFRPRSAGHRASDQLDLDVDARRQVVEPLERVDRLRAWADGCRSAACACGSRSARASPCP